MSEDTQNQAQGKQLAAFKIDEQQVQSHLDGMVRVPRLLQAAGAGPLAAYLETDVPALPAWSPVQGAPEAEGWRAYNALPVVDHAGNLVGVLPAGVLSRAVAESGRVRTEGEGIGWAVVRAYGAALGGLVGVLVGEGERGG